MGVYGEWVGGWVGGWAVYLVTPVLVDAREDDVARLGGQGGKDAL